MTTISHLLTDLTIFKNVNSELGLDDAELETRKLESFENGYQAGWDDATKAYHEKGGDLSEIFSSTLQDLSFTYNEAVTNVTAGLGPLMDKIAQELLPEIVAQSFGPQIGQIIKSAVEKTPTTQVVISVHPSKSEQLNNYLPEKLGMPLKIVSDQTIDEFGALIGFDHSEFDVNFDECLSNMQQSLQAHFSIQYKEVSNG